MVRLLVLLFFIPFLQAQNAVDSKLLFLEEFNQNSIDLENWSYELGDGCPDLCGWGNNEWQVYTKRNVSINNNQLVISATNEAGNYYSGRITSKDKFEFRYGTIEVKAKLPKGRGLWPAIWMLGHDIDSNPWPACGEIDLMEYVGKHPGKIYTTLHSPASFGQSINTKTTSIESIETGFHVYKTRWDAHQIQFYIDNTLVYTFSPEIKNEKTWPFDKPFYVILNLAIGGNFGGPEVDDSIFPKEFVVDYVKVYQ
jgi:beta-glucanase (GH16 family)